MKYHDNLNPKDIKNLNVRRVFATKRMYKGKERVQRLVSIPKELSYQHGDLVIILPYNKEE